MYNFSYENQGTNTFLVYAVSPEDEIDSMSLGMLTNNRIPGLAVTLFTQMDAVRYIKYNVSAKVSVRQFFSGSVNKRSLLGVFKGIVHALLSVEDYMIDEHMLILDLDYIFADVSTCETSLICLPIQSAVQEQDFGAFFKQIMFNTQFDQTENCDYIARIINYLNSTPLFSLTDFKNLLEKIEQAPSLPTAGVNVQQPYAKPVTLPPISPKAEISVPSAQRSTVPPENKPEMAVYSVPGMASQNQPKQPVIQPASPAPNTVSGNEKQISMFGLLMHYSKENAQLYKAQKAAQKNAQVSVTKKAAKKQQPQAGFPVPGAPSADQGFAIPGQAAPPPAAQPPVQSAPPPKNNYTPHPQPQPRVINVSTAVQQPAYVPRQVPQGQTANFGETSVLGGGAVGETTVLTAAQNPVPYLIRSKNNERISLTKPVFRVGQEKSYVDYFVGDNTAVSRSHANFITRDGAYYVVDTNSTNHTFVNGIMIPSNVETQLSHGDAVRLANEDFEFRLY